MQRRQNAITWNLLVLYFIPYNNKINEVDVKKIDILLIVFFSVGEGFVKERRVC